MAVGRRDGLINKENSKINEKEKYLYRFGCSRDGTFASAGNGGITIEVLLLFDDTGRAKFMLSYKKYR
jgi:hypothetical protein